MLHTEKRGIFVETVASVHPVPSVDGQPNLISPATPVGLFESSKQSEEIGIIRKKSRAFVGLLTEVLWSPRPHPVIAILNTDSIGNKKFCPPDGPIIVNFAPLQNHESKLAQPSWSFTSPQ